MIRMLTRAMDHARRRVALAWAPTALALTMTVMSCADDGGSSTGDPDAAGDANDVVDGTGDTATADSSGDADGSEQGELPLGDTYTNFAFGFLTSYCTACHQSGGLASRVDLTTYDGVLDVAATIRCGTSPVQLDDCPDRGVPYTPRFPVGNGPRPSEEERQRLIDWIDDGLPQ